MQNQLIPTFTGTLAGEIQTLVNARDLHVVLEPSTRFNDWIVRRIEQYGFTEGEDFYSVLSKAMFGRDKTEYHLSLDMAKELAMLEMNDKGRAARRYFIHMEKVARQEIPGQVEALQTARLKATLLAAKPQWQKLQRYHALRLSQGEIATLLGIKPSTVRDKLRELAACGLVDYATNPQLSAAGRKGLMVIKQRQEVRHV